VAELSAIVGRPLFPAQRYVLDVALEVVPEGGEGTLTLEEIEAGAPWWWAYDDVTVLMPRRAGKTAMISPLVLHRIGRPGVRSSVWMTAQKRENARKRYEDIRRDFQSVPGIRAMLARALISNAAEVIEWAGNGSTFRPFAPDEESMHGEDPDMVLVDELWAFPLPVMDVIQAGYRPSWSVKPGQEWKFSAAGTARSGWLRHERVKGRRAVEEGRRAGVAFFEWCVPTMVPVVGRRDMVPVEDLGDEDLVELVWLNHPRAGHGLRKSFLLSELGRGRGVFLRHYGGLDDMVTDDPSPIPLSVWERAGKARDLAPPDGARVGLGFAVDQGRRLSAVYAAWRLEDGTARVVEVEVSPGTRWLAGRVASVLEQWPDVEVVAYRNVGLGRDAAADLERAGLGVELLAVTASDYAAASQRLYAGVAEGESPMVFHDGAVSSSLTDAMRAAALPDSRVGSGWTQAGTDPVAALEAASLAVWAADHLPAREPVFSWSVF
jgi:phage terminase